MAVALGASGVLRGLFAIAEQNGANAIVYSVGGIPSSVSQGVVISQCYIWEGSNNYVFQFRIPVNDANLSQRNWRTINSSLGPGIGVASGAFTLDIGAIEYLVMPTAGVGYFDGTGYLYFQILSPKNPLGTSG